MKVFNLVLLACIFFTAAFALEHSTRSFGTQEIEDVKNYWTEEKMREAIDRDVLISDGAPEPDTQGSFASLVDVPEEVSESGRDSIYFPTVGFNGNNTDDKKRYPFPYSSGYAPSYTAYPWRTVGKVFFSVGTLNYVCSANVLRQNVIHTAGHCVYDSATGWVSNFIFVPGYNNGAQPYGLWHAYQFRITTDWQLYSSFCRDYATVVMYKNSNAQLGDVVGYLGYSYNAGYSQTWRSLGYPSAAPFNGQLNYYADSAFGTQDARCGGRCNANGVCTPATIGIGSDATPGCSGGPWVKGWGTDNQLNGVNSYKFNNQPAAIYSPYLDTFWFDNVVNPSFAVNPPTL